MRADVTRCVVVAPGHTLDILQLHQTNLFSRPINHLTTPRIYLVTLWREDPRVRSHRHYLLNCE